jgi:hypothetical protein
MFKTLKLLTAAALLTGFAASANAAPNSAVGPNALGGANSERNLVEVHGRHRACRFGVRGWHRHTWRRGERVRISCRSYRRDYRHRYDRDCIRIGDVLKICPE